MRLTFQTLYLPYPHNLYAYTKNPLGVENEKKSTRNDVIDLLLLTKFVFGLGFHLHFEYERSEKMCKTFFLFVFMVF